MLMKSTINVRMDQRGPSDAALLRQPEPMMPKKDGDFFNATCTLCSTTTQRQTTILCQHLFLRFSMRIPSRYFGSIVFHLVKTLWMHSKQRIHQCRQMQRIVSRGTRDSKDAHSSRMAILVPCTRAIISSVVRIPGRTLHTAHAG